MQVNATLTEMDIRKQDSPGVIGAAGEAALVAALQVRRPSIAILAHVCRHVDINVEVSKWSGHWVSMRMRRLMWA
jgi:hypothetical protein